MTTLLLLSTLALANNTGNVRYETGTSTSLPIEAGTLAGVDGVGSAASKRLLEAIEVTSQRTGYPVRRDARCESGAVGVLTLAEVRDRRASNEHGVQVDEKALAVSARSTSYGETLRTSATRNGEHIGVSQAWDHSSLDIGYAERVPATESVGTVSATARWVLKSCDGTPIYDDIEQVTLERRQLVQIDGRAAGKPVDTAAMARDDAPEALAELHVGRFDVRSVTVVRRFYDNGTAGLQAAAAFVKGRHQDWEAAREAWIDATYASDPKIQARGHYNLALYHERAGNLEQALASVKASLQARRSRHAVTLHDELEAKVARARHSAR